MLFVFTAYKIIKLFVKLFVKIFVKLPIRIVKLVAGATSSDDGDGGDDPDGYAEEDTGRARATESAGGTGNESAAAVGDTRTGGEGSTRRSTPSGAGGPEPKGAVDTLKWAFEFLTRRTEIVLPLAALGVFQVLISGATFLGLPPAIVTLGSLAYLPASVFVAGIVISAAADDIGGGWRSNAEYAGEAADRFLPALATTIVLGIAVAIGLLLLVLPGLYLFVRFGFALPAVFAGGYGAIESIKESWARTGDYQLTVAGIFAATFLFGLLQFIPIVGPFVVTIVGTPLAMGSMTYLFLVTESDGGARPETEAEPTAEPAGAEPTAESGAAETGTASAAAPTETGDSPVEATESEGSEWSPDVTDTAATGTEPTGTTGPESAGSEGEPGAEPGGAAADGTDSTAEGASRAASEPATGGTGDGTETETESPEDGDRSESSADETAIAPEAGSDVLPDDETERLTRLIDEIEAGGAGPERFDPLVDLLDSDSAGVRREAAAALGTLGSRYPEAADEAIDALQDCRLDPDIGVSDAASEAVDEIKGAR